MRPGTVLDVGCGEGADAVWLALAGWTVTAVDPSVVALERAEAAAAAAGVDITFVHAGLQTMPGGPGRHDLVSAQYAALRHDPDDTAIHALLDAVAPGGTLLAVHHDDFDPNHRNGHEHGHDDAHTGGEHDEERIDPADFVMPDDVVAHLDDGWDVEVHEVRERPGPLPGDAHHVRDVVLRARRR